MKLYTFTIPQKAPGGRLFAYARRMLPDVPEYALREAFQKRDVKLNGKRVDLNAAIEPGAEVRIYARETQSQKPPVAVVYQDENVLVVVKPAGVSCEPDAKGGKTLTQLVHEQLLDEDTDAREPLLCHRLDNPTEGLIVLARTPEGQESLQSAFRERRIHKEYTCVVRGTPNPAHAVLEAYLQKDALRSKVKVTARAVPGAKRIVTEYTVLQPGECARLRILLHTGRTHQIRAHLASVGHPLLGDDLYGDRALNKRLKARRLRLCATQLRFSLEGGLAYLNEYTFSCEPSF
ncbi:MAG: RluA family pseudouridine synthase [Clostridiales bacterium]|nr:RluA family pseudouridine synthase [Clostridiales bacterium]